MAVILRALSLNIKRHTHRYPSWVLSKILSITPLIKYQACLQMTGMKFNKFRQQEEEQVFIVMLQMCRFWKLVWYGHQLSSQNKKKNKNKRILHENPNLALSFQTILILIINSKTKLKNTMVKILYQSTLSTYLQIVYMIMSVFVR